MSAKTMLRKPWIKNEWEETSLDPSERLRLSHTAQAVMGIEAIAELLLIDMDMQTTEEGEDDISGLLGSFRRSYLLNGLAALAHSANCNMEQLCRQLQRAKKEGRSHD